MSQTYTPDETNNPSTYQTPEDGELASVASILAICEGVADKAHHILEGAATFIDAKTFSNEVTFNDAITITAAADAIEYTAPVTAVEVAICDFGANGSNTEVRLPFSATIAAGDLARFPVRLPDGETITGYKVDIVRGANTPGTECTVAFGYNNMTGTTTNIDTEVAAAGTGATTITSTGLSHVYAPAGRAYFIEVQGETGGTPDSVTLTGIRMVYTISGLPLKR
jgi:hypothetical protein